MTNITLYELAEEYRQAASTLADMDLPQDAVADTLDGLSGALEAKAVNVAMLVRNLESMAEQIRAAEDAMAARRQAIEVRAERIRNYLESAMLSCSISRIECPYFELAIVENPPSVMVELDADIPQEFMRQPETPAPRPDKKAISEALKSGRKIPGVYLQKKKRLRIKC